MDILDLSDTEQRVQGFQSRIRVDYATKIKEVAKLTDDVAKLQTQLLDFEHENNVLRQQLVIAKNEIIELKKDATLDKSSHVDTTSSPRTLQTSLKRERSSTLETATMPRHSSKKPKAKATTGKTSAGQAAEQNNVQTLVKSCSAVKTLAKKPESESSSGSSSDNPDASESSSDD
ncbi:hypothetical protein BJ912DRAFT_994405 [Pholiota molesta]|nr:hypothetical protein BJ912DRAFT_994405 [Pholiota molesta]